MKWLAVLIDAVALLLLAWFARSLVRHDRRRAETVPGADGGGLTSMVLIGVSLLLLSVPMWSQS
ncbi:hypothetical protein [Actinomadura fibrosa]|uniref:Uncharacterized protein n=1 Tax=Actinomadura fibrosa TaxID=111802 RepID=A0ABW2XRB9_9ACTN|nr:hypothetical protein [Actinomadura fibrosa]